ncbi:MAG: hypothetical protein M0T75_09070 [Chloroflexi bacterium]|nr:hypothetical protein [Chloroflexota bacterium]
MTSRDQLRPAGRARPATDHSPARRREVSAVNAIRIIHAVHADRAARFEAEARQARIARRAPRADERRIRRVIGRSIVRIGARIAAEPAPERLLPAGPR